MNREESLEADQTKDGTVEGAGPRQSAFVESYRRLDDTESEDFDIAFWQRQGPEAIFDAARELIRDWQIVRQGHAEEPRMDRTVEYYGKK